MKKALLLTLEFPPDRGGVARYLGVLAEDERIFVATFDSGSSPRKGRLGGVAAIPTTTPNPSLGRRGTLSWFPLLWRVPFLVRKKRADLLLISHVLPVGYAALVARIFGTPYAVICHGLDVTGPRKSGWKKFWAAAVLRLARTVIANSKATRDEVLRYGISTSRVRVVSPPHSWDPATLKEDFETDLRERFNLQNKRVLLVAGRLVPRKGVDIAIEALSSLSDENPPVLLVVGDGPEKKNLEKRAFELGGRVIFSSSLSDEELRDAYRAAEIVLYPSREISGDLEGYGIGAADAGMFGKPVIAARTGGLVEAVEDGVTGLLIPPGNTKALAEAIQALLDDSASARRLGEEGKRRALARGHAGFRKVFWENLNI